MDNPDGLDNKIRKANVLWALATSMEKVVNQFDLTDAEEIELKHSRKIFIGLAERVDQEIGKSIRCGNEIKALRCG